MEGKINIQFDRLIYQLLCIYAFLIPLEKVLLVLFDVDTVLKPYRVLALLILFTFGIKITFGVDKNTHLRKDMFLYFIFAYGLIVTLFRMVTGKFYLGYLYNDAFQLGLYLGVFVVIRHCDLSKEKIRTIWKFLAGGVMTNAAYALYQYYVLKNFRRSAGFMDNPNYMAIGVLVVLLFFIVYRTEVRGWLRKLAWWGGLLFLGNAFITAGSRTALAVLAVAAVIIFYFSTVRQKVFLVTTTAGILIFFALASQQIDKQTPLTLLNRLDKVSSEDDRLPIWKGVVRAAQETNFIGVGIGQFKGRFSEFYQEENNNFIRRIRERGYFASPHSDYLALLVIYGIVGLLSYLIFMFLSGKSILTRLLESTKSKDKLYFQFSLLTLVTLILFGFTAESFTSGLYWLLLATSTRIQVI